MSKHTNQNLIAVRGSIEGRLTTMSKLLYDPQIKTVAWIDKSTGKETETGKCGREMELHIETDSSVGCWLLIEMYSEDWEKLYQTRIVQVDGNHVDIPEITVKEKTIFRIKPEPKWLKQSTNKAAITTKVYVLHTFLNYSLINKYSEQSYSDELAAYYRGENKMMLHGFDNIQQCDTKEAKKIEVSRIVIVIDPGHGYKNSHQGTQCRGFQYYEQDAKGEPDKTKIKTAKVSNLPPYVLIDIEKWIVKWVNTSVSAKEQEWNYVIQISLKLKKELEKENAYNVIFTREGISEQDKQIETSDSFPNRRKASNDNNADYFLSLLTD